MRVSFGRTPWVNFTQVAARSPCWWPKGVSLNDLARMPQTVRDEKKDWSSTYLRVGSKVQERPYTEKNSSLAQTH